MDEGSGDSGMTVGKQPDGITEHDLFVGIQPHDHHPEVEHDRVQINGMSIAPGDHEHRITWTRDDHLVTEVVLKGPSSIIGAGSQGVWACGHQTSGESTSRSSSGSGVYTYVASFSRLHGDSYLSDSIFGTGCLLKDIYLDGDETVLVFRNTYPSSRTLRAWGLVTAK